MDEKQFQAITNKMDLIARLLALDIVKDLKVQKEKIITLASFGFGPSEMAKLLGTTSHLVSVVLSDVKKKDKQEEQPTKAANAEVKATQNKEPAKESEPIA